MTTPKEFMSQHHYGVDNEKLSSFDDTMAYLRGKTDKSLRKLRGRVAGAKPTIGIVVTAPGGIQHRIMRSMVHEEIDRRGLSF